MTLTENLNITIKSPLVKSTRKYNGNIKWDDFKLKVEQTSGIEVANQVYPDLQKIPNGDVLLSDLLGGNEGGSFSNDIQISVYDSNPQSIVNNLKNEDLDVNDRYKMSKDKYEALDNSVLKWKKKELLAEYSINPPNNVQVGDKVHHNLKGSGLVKFIGKVKEIDSGERWWVGVEWDNGGKHDGSIKGHRYFTCKEGSGSFVLANGLTKENGGTGNNDKNETNEKEKEKEKEEEEDFII
ncbi:hypothetical protein DAMA08_041390 [Martiniozyma asiatica (nom. inval.)]|nr:hypothetical protein DAMA08_041390 [Martiniozyma asiatica]